jgi:integrase
VALYKKPDSPFWWADICMAGKRHRISTKQKGKTMAQQVEAALIQELRTGERRGIRTKAPLLREYANTFLSRITASRLESKTKEYYATGWKMLRSTAIADMRLDAITSGATSSLSIPGSPSKVNNGLRTLRRMLAMAYEDEVLFRLPKIRLAKEMGRERLVGASEEKLILEKAPQTLRDAFLLIFDAGMRPMEVAELQWENVDLLRGVILVARSKTRSGRRHLPLTQRVRDMLVARLSKVETGSKWVFPSPRYPGKPLARPSISAMFAQFKREIGLPKDLVLYSARHTFATDLMGATGNLSQTQRMLGHASIATSTRYLHPAVAELGMIMDARNSKRLSESHVSSHGTGTIQ